jgi:hypothetical protein
VDEGSDKQKEILMNIADGTYAARPGAASVYESEKGALVLAIMMKIADGVELKSYHTLVLADGTVNTRTVDNLKSWSGWDGADPYWFMDQDLSAVDVEVVVAHEPGFTDKSKMFAKIKWVNAPGGGSGGMPEAADRRAVLAKYGAKFRAVAGGTPVGAGAPAVGRSGGGAIAPTVGRSGGQAVAPVQANLPHRDDLPCPARSVAAPVRTKAGVTQAVAWGRMCVLGAQLPQGDREAIWFEAVDATGMDQADMTPEGWAQVLAAIEARFAGAAGAAAVAYEDPMPF